MPAFVDRIYVVNDASTDRTLEISSDLAKRDGRVVTVNREIRGGAGAAAISGLERALSEDIDIVAIMDGDGQMVPAILSRFLDPLVSGEADYAKGTRLSRWQDRREMPLLRLFGNLLLTNLTRMASGYWHISDPQNGYTAMSSEYLRRIDLGKVERGFAFENDMLVKLSVAGAKVLDVPHPAIYRGQQSKIQYPGFIARTSWVLLRDLLWRLWTRLSFRLLTGPDRRRSVDDTLGD
jgi:glycosyltransferase involved in cell wall biosynthesis